MKEKKLVKRWGQRKENSRILSRPPERRMEMQEDWGKNEKPLGKPGNCRKGLLEIGRKKGETYLTKDGFEAQRKAEFVGLQIMAQNGDGVDKNDATRL